MRWPMIIGTWVRIPGPPNICSYFSSCDYMQASKSILPCTPHNNAPSGHKHRSNGHRMKDHGIPSQCRRGRARKSTRLVKQMGLRIASIPPKLAHHPLVYYFFLFSLSFNYFINYNNNYYFLINS